MLKIVIIGGAAAVVTVAAVLAYAATRPDHFQIQRSTTIKASADRIFPLINDLRAFNSWNPFEKKDPNGKGAYSGPPSGTGAGYAFDSAKAGTGRLEIVDVAAPSRVTMRLTMVKPMRADNRVDFTLERQGDTTRVTWAMDGQVPFIGKVFHIFVDVDRMVGDDFEAGLADLKTAAEKSPSPAS